jgi:hypothetical protein
MDGLEFEDGRVTLEVEEVPSEGRGSARGGPAPKTRRSAHGARAAT